MTISKLIAIAAASLAVAPTILAAPYKGAKMDIVDTAASAGSFKTLVAAVKAAGLVDALKGDGPFTVFAPTDDAPDGDVPASTAFTQERAPDVTAAIMDQALRAHKALSCSGYSRSDFIISDKGPVYLETNTLPGLTKASLYPKALKAQGIDFADFLRDQILLGERRPRK